eukprot:TRINITY_DN13730_c0_g1_i3.p1 TRINITY_DN13730_c0_g1~~TRINITY_DN13730_c0_g1_i3.p1  ORF type:complete len:538 (-),score=61.42 TRINITY_DN13730_c0_g1_i3:194-1807(-)
MACKPCGYRRTLPTIFLLAAVVPCQQAPTDCLGTALVAQDVWTLAREIDKAIQVTHIPRSYSEDLANAFFALERSGALPDAIKDCALGVAVLAVHTLPHSELRFGTAVAKKHYLLYEQLVKDYRHLWNASGFSWNLDTHQSASYPLLLGLRPQSCFGLGIKVFVYDTEFAQRPIGCSQGMFASEVFVHRFLLHSECRTEDPNEADFFFVPVYAACVMTKESKLAGDMDAFYKRLVTQELPHFKDQGGRDHIFLWSSETYDFPSWAEYIHDSIFLSVEATPIECSDFDFFSEETADNFGAHCAHCSWCFTPWKDLVIPGFVEKWSVRKMQSVDKLFKERSYTACYHGADSDNLAIYKYANATARNDLQTLRDRPGFSIGYRIPRIMDYFNRIGDCHFCFAPKGLGYWSNRLYEVFFTGCIPVILSDDIGLPFEEFLDWSTFSIKWPMKEVGLELAEYLERLLQENRPLVERMQDTVRRVRCWFDYNSGNPSCSPYLGILRALKIRKAAMPRSRAGKFWRGNAPVVRGSPGAVLLREGK